MRSAALLLFATSLSAWLGCSSAPRDAAPSEAPVARPPAHDLAPSLYPTLDALYGGAQGIYRGCGPNNGVCHNGKEFPNFATVGGVVEAIGALCNEKREDPRQMHDMCEREGDHLRLGATSIEIAWIEPASDESPARSWKVHLRDPAAGASLGRLEVVRGGSASDASVGKVLYAFDDFGASGAIDPQDPRVVTLTLPGPDPQQPQDVGAFLATILKSAGVPGDPAAIQVGDPNRDGVFGASLGARLVVPGDPGKSYLFTRLTDPEAGPVMPRANCCYWTKPALRALYCWVAGLKEDGANALDPIDYASCPAGPVEDIAYPEPGPSCEMQAGACPVVPRTTVTDDPTWSNLYKNVFRPSCGGGACHVEQAVGGLDMTTEDAAFRDITARVIPGKPEESKLVQRLDPTACKAPDCATMPLGRAPLSDRVRGIVAAWITAGATRD